MFRFPTQKLKAPDQPQSAGEESLLTNDITWLLVQHLVKVLSKSKAINVFHVLKSKLHDHSIQASKKLFCLVIVKII